LTIELKATLVSEKYCAVTNNGEKSMSATASVKQAPNYLPVVTKLQHVPILWTSNNFA